MAALGLRDLVFVVGEGEVLAAAMDVDGLAEELIDHRGAFDMPAGSAVAVGGFPVGLAGLVGLPEREVERILLHVGDVDARARFEVFDRHVGKLAVFLKLLRAEVNVAVDLVSEALFHKGIDDIENAVDVLGRLRVDGCGLYAEALGVLVVFLDIALCDFLDGHALLVGLTDHLVVHVGEVLDEGDVVAAVAEVTAEHIEYNEATRVADMEIVIYGRAAGVHADLARLYGNQLFLLLG